jgi:hypothetical protein
MWYAESIKMGDPHRFHFASRATPASNKNNIRRNEPTGSDASSRNHNLWYEIALFG